MIAYVIYENPDDRVISKAVDHIQNGGIISFPTDTNWVLATSPSSKKGIDSLYRIKGISRKKHLSILCKNISQASDYAIISDMVYKKIKRYLPGPYTLIFSPKNDIPRAIKDYRKNKEIGIRIPNSTLVQRLIEVNEGPIIATSITREMIGVDDDEDEFFSYQIEEAFSFLIDMIIDPSTDICVQNSTIINFTEEDSPLIVRAGCGDISWI